ncbi:RNA polymerase-associated protein LEO1 isoform X2 [Cheilinus undulatus]|uniref:RNA polymerase-associated protein LEO1 isoform X2 n=1 Tax=Cheilinus undulatus TaxID=241271 RepID=UPI001BD3F68B|nr:RNA polymerase-associated protein LEO1 isoform X2 [Cheilinus undulatus]
MEQSFADLLSDAFPDGDLEFENLHFEEEDKTDISAENMQTKEDDTLHQETTSQPAFLFSMDVKDTNMEENDEEDLSDEENFEEEGVISVEKTLGEDYTSSEGDSEQEGSLSGDDEEDEDEGEPGDSVCCGDDKEDRITAEGQPLDPQGDETPQDRNKERGEKEVSYFEQVPEHGCEMVIKGDEDDGRETEQAKQEDSESECEDMKIRQEEEVQFIEQDAENPYQEDNKRESLEFPQISVQNLQDLLAEVESGEFVEKVEDFSGEEHQEAGESYAEYPSDFSSCEYVEETHERNLQSHERSSKTNQDVSLESAQIDDAYIGRGEDTDEEGDEYLFSRNLELDDNEFRKLDTEKEGGKFEILEGDRGSEDESDDSDSCSSSDDDNEERRSDEERYATQESNKEYEELQIHTEFTTRSTSDDDHSADRIINWNLDVLTTPSLQFEDLLTTEDTDRVKTLLSDLTHPADDINTYSAVQREDAKTSTSSSYGSLDDSFFFNTEPHVSGVTELSQQGDDVYEEDRSWEQEQERIKAFYKYYDDSDKEEEREGRQTKVQFCMDPLSRVIHYDTDSDRESLSSSTDEEEDLSSAETSEGLQEPEEDIKDIKPAFEPPYTDIPEDVPDLSITPVCSQKHRCLGILKLTLRMAVVILMGLAVFWLVTDQEEMFSLLSFF